MARDRHRRRDAEKGLPYVQIYHWIRATPAWRSLGPYARCLYVEIRGRYNGSNNGNIPMSHREAQELLGCSNKPVMTAFHELQDRGFIKPVQKGSFSWKLRFEGVARATTWLLTELRQDFPETVLTPTHEFKTWKPENKTRYAEGTPKVCRKHTMKGEMVCPEHTIGMPRAHHKGPKRTSDGMPKAYTSISTISPVPVGDITRALLKSRIVSGGRAS